MAENEFDGFEQDEDIDGIDPIEMIGSDIDELMLNEPVDHASLQDTSQTSFDVIAPYESFDLDTDTYYFGATGSTGTNTKSNRKVSKGHDGLNPFIVAAIVFALIGGAGFVVWRLFSSHMGSSGGNAQTSKQENKGGTSGQQAATQPLQGKDIMAIVSQDFSYDGQDLSLSSSRLGVQIRNGNVVVTHSLEAGAKMVPESLVRNAGLRANTLAAKLTGELVGGGEGAFFQRLTWVVRDANGKAYLATIEAPGEVRTSNTTFGVLATSLGYVIAPGILNALGDNPGIAVRGGEQPTDLDGFAIAADSQYGARTVETKTDTNANAQATQQSETKDKDSDKKDSKKKKETKKDEKKEDSKKDSDQSSNKSDKSDKSSDKNSSGSNSGGSSSGGSSGGNSGGNTGGNTGGDDGGNSGETPGGDTGGDPVDPGGGGGGGDTEPTPDPDPDPPASDPTPQPDPSDGETPGE